MKRGSSTRTVVGLDAQVDLCPSEGGMVVSFGRTSIWLDRGEAEDLVATLEQALLLSIKEGTASDGGSSADDAGRAPRRAHAS
jgi:hypothetical protein